MLTPTNSYILRSIKGIIFDCDGVMFDTRELNARYYDKIIQKLGLPPLTEKQQELAFALTAQELFDRFVGKNRAEEIKRICADFPYEELIPQMKIENGLLLLVQFLYKKISAVRSIPIAAIQWNRSLNILVLHRIFSPL